ncbi:MAG: metallophosphoesterase [Lachnospiraceae bacterium]|nr:metallophosphoesterase [Lachnospiraceae bacterium]
MRFIIISDTHRYIDKAIDVLEHFKEDADGFIHLGDHFDDAEKLHRQFPDMRYYSVLGNNDFNFEASHSKIAFIGGKKILLTHGHKQRVSFGLMYLDYFGRQEEADAVLFGHTHRPSLEFSGNMAMFNPGSISLPRSTYEPTFGIMDVKDGNIKFSVYMIKGTGNYEEIKI